jgi:hypothetical protein
MEYNDLILELEDAITDSIVSEGMQIEQDLLHSNFRRILKKHLEAVDPLKESVTTFEIQSDNCDVTLFTTDNYSGKINTNHSSKLREGLEKGYLSGNDLEELRKLEEVNQ